MPTIDIAATGKNIRAKMDAAGKTVKDIQNACGFTTGNAVYKWINGACMPTIDNMVIMETAFGFTVTEEAVTEENGEDAYSAIHTYKPARTRKRKAKAEKSRL